MRSSFWIATGLCDVTFNPGRIARTDRLLPGCCFTLSSNTALLKPLPPDNQRELIMVFSDIDFIRESNRIEGIFRDPTTQEIDEFYRFLGLDRITIDDIAQFVSVYQPDALLRDKPGLNVRIGNHFPPKGSKKIRRELNDILDSAEQNHESAYYTHMAYEKLHPFTDGNGRSGRMLWRWQMVYAPLGFLHSWYYQTLSFRRD